MKRISFLTTFLTVLFFAASLFAAGTVNVNWSKNTEPDVAGYNIYYGTSSGSYSEEMYVNQDTFCADASCSYQFNNLQEGQTWYFVLKAVDDSGQESLVFSNETSKYLESSYTVGGVSISQLFYELPTGLYELRVNADGTYTVEPLGNSEPVVSISANSLEVLESEAVIITASASDPEGDPLAYAWYVDEVLDFFGDSSGSWTDLPVGSHSIYCVVDDGQDNVVQSNTVTVAILAGPHISVPEILVLNATYGDTTVTGNIVVANSGNGDMYWTASTTSGMLLLNPKSGTNIGNVGVVANLFRLDPGDYYGDVIISSYDADNSPQTVPVMVTIADVVENTASIDLIGNAYLSIADASQVGLDITGDITLEAWIKLEQLPSTAGSLNFTIICKHDELNVRSYQFYVNDADDKLTVQISDDGSNNAGHIVTYVAQTAFDSNDVGNWIHVAFTHDISTEGGLFYINGNEEAGSKTGSVGASMYDTSAPFLIGARFNNGAPQHYFDGLMDEVRAWNDIRTSTEISDNYDCSLDGSESGLVGYWKFENDLTDSASIKNTLTNNGGAVFSTDIP